MHDLSKAGTIALDMLDTGVIAVDEQGHILLANRQAEAVLDGGRGLDVHWGRLAATDPNEAIRLERLISSAARAARGRDTPNDGLITLHGAAGSPPISAIVTPFRSDRIFAQGRPCALIFVYDSAAKMGCRGATLQKLFGLTPAECRLAGLLHSGLELRIAAQTLCVTPDTARFMLKKIFGKTRSHRQSELIQLMNRLPGEPQSLKHSQADE